MSDQKPFYEINLPKKTTKTAFLLIENNKRIWVHDQSGFNGLSGYWATPCTSCTTLSKEDMLKLRALRLELNR